MAEELDINSIMQQQEKKSIDSAIYDVLKELSDTKKSLILSELSDNEIKLITRLKMISKMRHNKRYNQAADIFMMLRISKNRKSRGEIISGIKAAHPEQTNHNFLQREKLQQLLS